MISASPEGGAQATKGRTVTLTVSKGPQGVAVPKRRRPAAATQAEHAAEVGRADRRRDRGGDDAAGRHRDGAGPGGRARACAKGATVKLTVAKARPEVPDVTTGNPTVEEATETLEEAGFKVQTRDRRRRRRRSSAA